MLATENSREQQLAAFYRQHHRRVERIVARAASERGGASPADACAVAWMKLAGRADVALDARGASWLATVAIHEAWAEARRRQVERPSGTLCGEFEPGEAGEPTGPASDPLDRAIELDEHRDRRERFATASAREREALLLHALGYRYKEISAITGASYTAVNRRITEGRRRVRAPLTPDPADDARVRA
jgi:RNA polymerase sigma factor (sigma-70 family)